MKLGTKDSTDHGANLSTWLHDMIAWSVVFYTAKNGLTGTNKKKSFSQNLLFAPLPILAEIQRQKSKFSS